VFERLVEKFTDALLESVGYHFETAEDAEQLALELAEIVGKVIQDAFYH